MKFRALDVNGDWTFGKGRQDYLINNDAIMLNIKTRLLSFLNDCFFAMNEGIDWFTILGQKDRGLILSAVRKILISSYGVTRINSTDFYSGEDRKLYLTYNINSIFTTNASAIQEVPF